MKIKEQISALLEENRAVHAASYSSEDRDFKYVMQDTGTYYFGARMSFADLLVSDEVPFKFKAIVEHYVRKDTEPETTLESCLYYLEKDSFTFQTFLQLKARIKVSVLVEKKSLFGKKSVRYEEKVLSLKELCDMNLARKKASGMIVRELIVSKLALMGFSV